MVPIQRRNVVSEASVSTVAQVLWNGRTVIAQS